MANILFTSLGTGGDVLPLLRIGSQLKTRGHDVGLLTHVSYAGLAAEAGLDFAALDAAEECARSVEDGPLLNTPRGIPEFLRRHYFPRVPLECELIQQRFRASDTILVARDLFDIGARIAAEKFGIPLLWMFVSPSQLLNRQLRQELFARVLATDVNNLRGRLGLPPVTDWHSWLSYPGRSLAIWPSWFAAPDPAWAAEIVPVGFVLDNEGESGNVPEGIRRALDAGERPILITGGTGTFTGAAFYGACVEACRQAGRRAILVTAHDQLVPSVLPERIERYSHLPLGKLMPLMEVVLHHGGRGTMSCALASGTPQAVLAWGADRPDNAVRLEQLGVAKYLPRPDWKAETVRKALESLAGSSAVRERCREVAGRIAGTDSLTAACQVIEDALRSKGLTGGEAQRVDFVGS
jgi:rhamnosyltransferase subunit B